MLKKYLTIEFVFFLTGFLIFIYRTLFVNGSFDITFHDTYLVIDSMHVTIVLMTLFGFLALPYLLLRRNGTPMYKVMGWVHYFLTILPWFVSEIVNPVLARYPANESFSRTMADSDKYYIVIFVAALLFMTGQLIFFINIILTLFKKRMDV